MAYLIQSRLFKISRNWSILVMTVLLMSTHTVCAQQIAITIDDAPFPDSVLFQGKARSRFLIQQLKEARVDQVAFFIVGKYADTPEGMERVRMYADAGHLIANHSYHHWDLDKVKSKDFCDDILKTDRLLSTIATFRKWFRFPLLHEGETIKKRDELRSFLHEKNYRNGYVTIDTWDFYLQKLLNDGLKKGWHFDRIRLQQLYLDHIYRAATFYENIAQKYIGQPVSHTLLLHDNDLTALFIKYLAMFFRAQGWTVISPEQAYKNALLDREPDLLLNNQGRVMALAIVQGYQGPFDNGENAHALETLFARYQVWTQQD